MQHLSQYSQANIVLVQRPAQSNAALNSTVSQCLERALIL